MTSKVGFFFACYALLVLTGGFTQAALVILATGNEGFVDLSWEQDEHEIFAGYHLYRAETGSDSFQRVNRSIIPVGTTTYRDTNTFPGQNYDYYFNVVLTDLTESDSSNIETVASLDTIPTRITHTPVTSAQPNLALTITANITDNVSVSTATLHHRPVGSNSSYRSENMANISGDRWTAILEGPFLQSPGVEYYISATDGISTTSVGRSESPYLITMDDHPVVTDIMPNHGPATGGTILQVTGTNFREGATVTFGSTPATSVTFVSETQLEVTTPSHIPATLTVTVLNPAGGLDTVLNSFTFTDDLGSMYLPQQTGESRGIVSIPLEIVNVSGLVAFGATITYDPTKLIFSSLATTALVENWNLEANTAVAGLVRLASASNETALVGTGSVATLNFRVLGQPGEVTPIRLGDVSLNGSTVTPFSNLGGVIIVQDTTKPIITLLGESQLQFEASPTETYLDAGATCQDLIDGELSDALVASGDTVDLSAPGTYQVIYNCADLSGNAADPVTRTIIVQDTTRPVIQIIGQDVVTIELGLAYDDLGATAVDSLDGDLVVTTENNVDNSSVGSYTVYYQAIDMAGNTAQASRIVNVVVTSAPRITSIVGNQNAGILSSVEITFTSYRNQRYVVETSRNLQDWQVLQAVTGMMNRTVVSVGRTFQESGPIFYRIGLILESE